jgi:hypothetical protein
VSTTLAATMRGSILAPAIALGAYAVMAAITAGSILFAVAGGTEVGAPILISPLLLSLEIVIAALILRRHPRHAIGWLLAVHAIGMASFAAMTMLVIVAITSPEPLPGSDVLYWYARWAWWPFWLMLFIPLLFPDGRLPSPRWRVVMVLDAVIVLTVVVGNAFAQIPLRISGRDLPPNPFVADPGVTAALEAFFRVGAPIVMLLSVAALISRYRSGDARTRSQLKWVIFGFVAVLGFGALIAVLGPVLPRPITTASMPLTFLLIPASIGIAILRYRLYDIDVLIRRTLTYAVISAVLVATYVAGVVLIGAALRPFIGGSDLAVAVSTLLVVALFQPIRRRVQDVVDRRFYRYRYDAARTLDAFAARLRDQVELEAVRADLLGVVGETIRPAHASVWLRSQQR